LQLPSTTASLKQGENDPSENDTPRTPPGGEEEEEEEEEFRLEAAAGAAAAPRDAKSSVLQKDPMNASF
jgi:hypothetical protein